MNEETTNIEQILQGKTEQYRLLVERYHVGLIIHCERLLSDRDEAEDVAQDAFLQAYQNLSNYDPAKSCFSTWLYRIATNKCLDTLRKKRKQLNVDDIEAIAAATQPAHMEQDDARRLRAAVEALTPPQYRQIIEAYFWEGKSYKQIAQELNITVSNVGVSMTRAKAQLKEALV